MELGARHFKIPRWTIAGLFYAISIASLVWVFYGIDLDSVLDDFRSMHWGWLALAVVSDIGVYAYQGWRWGLLLRPFERVPVWRSIQAIYVGLFANEVLPFRPGEVIRSYLQARWSKIPFSVALSSVIIERIFDGIWLIAVFAVTCTQVHLPKRMVDLAIGLGVVTLGATVFLGLVMFWKHHAHAAVSATRWGANLRVLVEDLHLMGRSASFYAAAAASLPYLLIQAIPIYAMIRGYDLDLTIWQVLVVLVIYRLGTAVPQLPGNVGLSQTAIVIALAMFGVDKTTATGLSVVTWGVITAPLVLAGFIALLITGGNITDLHRDARAHASGPMSAHAPQPATESSRPSQP
jgi:uncharacterized protein (TIRG00374 family)